MPNTLIKSDSKIRFHQIDCFRKHFAFFKALGIWPGETPSWWYTYYSKGFVFIFLILFIIIYTINFFFLPPKLEMYADEMTIYITELSVLSKVLAMGFKREEIKRILMTLEREIFQSNTDEGLNIIEGAKKSTLMYWKITAGISYVSNTANVLAPMIMHLIFSMALQFPVCNYSFIPESYIVLSYPAYVYQALCITIHVFYNVNFDTFLLGVIFLAIAQLDILDGNLRKVTIKCHNHYTTNKVEIERIALLEINKCIRHYDEIYKFCKLIQKTFSEVLFVEFSLGSCRLCACLFRFTLPAPTPFFFIFLSLYMTIVILQIMVPCWFGTRLMEKSKQISFAVYNCDWTSRSRQFKSNLRLLVERANKPLTITGGKMFLLSLGTFTSIINSAYSIFTLFRHMQSR